MSNKLKLVLIALVLAASTAVRAGEVAPAAAESGEAIGLYPLALPPGQEALQGRLAAQLHDGASSLPGVRAFDLIPRGACLPDEGGCLAAAARSAKLTQIVSAQITQQPKGYAMVLRLFEARDGAEKNTHKAEVQGGPLDLAGALEHGVCTLLGAAPCAGTIAVRTDETGCKVGAFAPKLFVDGKDEGSLPLAKPMSLPVGRHAIRAGSGEEHKVRVSYRREARLVCEVRAGTPELSLESNDAPAPMAALTTAPAAPVAALETKAAPKLTPLQGGGRLAIVGGAALLAISAGFGLYAHVQGAALDQRYASGELTDADKPAYDHVHTAGAVSVGTAIVGGAAILGGAAMLLFAPSSAPGRF